MYLLLKNYRPLLRQRPFYKLSENIIVRVPFPLQDKQPPKSCSASRADVEGRTRVQSQQSCGPFTSASQSGISVTHKRLRQIHSLALSHGPQEQGSKLSSQTSSGHLRAKQLNFCEICRIHSDENASNMSISVKSKISTSGVASYS